jgi:hypothetical protein
MSACYDVLGVCMAASALESQSLREVWRVTILPLATSTASQLCHLL